VRLSIIIACLNSHEIVRRQILHWKKQDFPDDVEIILMDDGSDPPLKNEIALKNFTIYPTNDTRPWTQPIARNKGAKLAKGEYFLFTDIDHILTRELIEVARNTTYDNHRFRREVGLLDAEGNFSQDYGMLKLWGIPQERLDRKGTRMRPHGNSFVIRASLYREVGGFREDLAMSYPQREDASMKRQLHRMGHPYTKAPDDERPCIYMIPNGFYCGDKDYNPFGMFHNLSRIIEKPTVTVVKKPVNKRVTVIIPARNEEFLERTINDVLDKSEGNTDVIAILDGYWPVVPIQDREKVTLVHHTTPIGQRAGVNEGARLTTADYVMKLDAHCIVDQGFDRKLVEPYENGILDKRTTTIPRMYNLHAFDWECNNCKKRTYQGPKPEICECQCKDFTRVIVWQPRLNRLTESWRFDSDMHFQYWRRYKRRREFEGDIVDVMSSVGACFFMPRDFFFEMDGLDEAHGSWGQFGTEIACKSWLIGGRHVVNKTTWFSHMFRTQKDFSFPYPISGTEQEKAKEYSRNLWLNNKWEKAQRPLKWLIDKFAPIPGWEEK